MKSTSRNTHVLPFCRGLFGVAKGCSTRSAVVSTLVIAAGCAGHHDESETVANTCQALVDAPLDAKDRSAVGFCLVPLTTGPGGEQTCAFACSATLIARNLVLTARHCVQGGLGAALFEGSFSAPLNSPETMNVTSSSSGAVGKPSWYSVNQVLVPSSTDAPNDIALLILNDIIDEREATAAGIDLKTNLAATDHPTEFTVVGRGIVHYDVDADGGRINVDTGDNQRRILQHVPFVCASDSAAMPCMSFSKKAPPPTSMYTLPLEYFSMGPAALDFDSGSGIFSQRNHESCLPRVVGVVSAMTIGIDGQPASTLGVRVSRFADFLRAGAETAARFGHYEKPEWTDE